MVDIIRRMSIQGVSQGLDKVAADLRGVAAAQGEVAAASQATATVTDTTSKKALSAAAAYNRLQASLDPVYQAQQRLMVAERTLARAQDQNLGSLSRQGELLALAEQRYKALAPVIDNVAARMSDSHVASNLMIAGMSQGLVGVATNARLAAYQSKQLSFQLFDIAQGIPLAFASPLYGLMNLATQTGQVSQLYMGQGGLKQAFKETRDMAVSFGARLVALGPTLLQFFTSPLGLVLLAVTAVGTAFAAMVGVITSNLPSVDRAIKIHENAIEGIKKAWKEAQKGPEEYRRRAMSEILFLTNQSKLAQQELLKQQIGGALGMGAFTGGGLAAQLREELLKIQASISWTDQQKAMKGYAGAIQEFLDSVDKGNPDLEKFNAAITDIANKHAGEVGFQRAAAAIREMAAAATLTQQRLKEVDAAIPDLRINQAFEAASQAPTLSDQAARDLEMARRRHGADLFAVGVKSPTGLAQAAAMREQATPFGEGESPEGRQFRADAAAGLALATALNAISEAETARKVTRDNAIESANVELTLVGKGIAEQTRLTEQTQMLQEAREAARQAGTVVSDEEIAQIKEAAAELGKLNEQIALKQLRSDTAFDRSQIFRSDTEQGVASAMRDIYSDKYLDHMHDFEAEQIRINDRLQEFSDLGRDITKGVLTDFFDAFEKGQDVFASLEAAGVGALEKIQSKLIDMLTDRLWDSLLGSLGGAFGGGAPAPVGAGLFHNGGIVGSGGTMRYVHPAYFDDAPRMHRGGLAGDEVPAILQRGERVLPRSASGGGVQVTVNNNGQPVEATAKDKGVDSRGVRQFEITLDAMVGAALKKRMTGPVLRR